LKIWDKKLLHRGHLEWQHLPTKFHEHPPIGSKVISGRHTDRQAGDFISPLSFFESRLKNTSITDMQETKGRGI
jgi:hypothetical protein